MARARSQLPPRARAFETRHRGNQGAIFDETFDAVPIDGSEFAGRAELEEVYCARFLLLDDTETFKNSENSRSLQADPAYRLIHADAETRNAFAVFERAA